MGTSIGTRRIENDLQSTISQHSFVGLSALLHHTSFLPNFLHENEIGHMGYYVDIMTSLFMQQQQQQQLQPQPLQERRATVQQQENFEPLKRMMGGPWDHHTN
jgi:hypothetical protein